LERETWLDGVVKEEDEIQILEKSSRNEESEIVNVEDIK